MHNAELLIKAFDFNMKAKQFNLAKETLDLIPFYNGKLILKTNNVSTTYFEDKMKKALSKELKSRPKFSLENSSINWKTHVNFGLAEKCFVCGISFTREESKLMGIGPVCGGWNYSFDPKLEINKEELEKVKRTVRERMLKNKGRRQYTDIIPLVEKLFKSENITIVRETERAIFFSFNEKAEYWIPRSAVVFYFGALFVQTWKAKEIINDLTKYL